MPLWCQLYGAVLFYRRQTGAQPLTMDIYAPSGDTITERPLVLIFHTGNFYPKGLMVVWPGVKSDSSDVEIATRFSQNGIYSSVMRLSSGMESYCCHTGRTNQYLINAAYRGVQDARTAIRFSVPVYEQGNPYGIDTSRIVLWGIGTGGYITLAAATPINTQMFWFQNSSDRMLLEMDYQIQWSLNRSMEIFGVHHTVYCQMQAVAWTPSASPNFEGVQ